MRLEGANVLLYIEPTEDKSAEPVIDRLTKKMFNVFKNNVKNTGIVMGNGHFTKGLSSMGHQECICGSISSGCDYLLNGEVATNYLCVHYLAYHRSEVPSEELEKLEKLEGSEELLDEDHEKLEFMLK